VFLLHPLQIIGKSVLVRNAPELGKKDIETTEVKLEQDLLYPALRGRDIQRWRATPELLTIITNHKIGADDFVSYEVMKQKYPLTYAYFRNFWGELTQKEDYWTYFAQVVDSAPAEVLDRRYLHWRRVSKPSAGGVRQVIQASNVPVYSASKIGPYTFQPYRVVWPRMASDIRAAVIGQVAIDVAGKPTEKRAIVPNDVVTLVGFDNEQEAHYFCACMNSVVVRAHIRSFSSPGRGFAPPSILEHTAIARFDAKNRIMMRLAEISLRCHEAAAVPNQDGLINEEVLLDEAAASLWRLSAADVAKMRDALGGT